MIGVATAESPPTHPYWRTRVCNKRDCGFRMIGCHAALQIIFGGKHDILSSSTNGTRKYEGRKYLFLCFFFLLFLSRPEHESSRFSS